MGPREGHQSATGPRRCIWEEMNVSDRFWGSGHAAPDPMTNFFALVLACIFAFTLAWANESISDFGEKFDCGYCVPLEIDRLAALLGDEVLRDMVCRLSSERYTPASLSNVLGIPEGQVMRRVNTLRGWGLVRMVRRDSARTIVEPLPGGGQTLARWATKYCPLGDACGYPGANPAGRDEGGREKVPDGVGVSARSPGETDLEGKLVTVFGGSGFIGRYVVKTLVAEGARVRVAVRNAEAAAFLKRLGEPGQVEVVAADVVGDEASITEAVTGAHMVVNSVGIIQEKGPQNFLYVHVDGSRRIASAAAIANVERLVEVSAIGADRNSDSLFGLTKATGEAAAQLGFPDVTVVRPSAVFGPEDKFFNRIAAVARSAPILPLYGGGRTVVQPVYVGDVSAAIVRILRDPDTRGRTYELGGPRTMTMREIFALAARQSGHARPLVSVPMWVAQVQATIFQWLPNPPLTPDQVKMLRRDNVVGPKALGLVDLGISPTPVEEVLHTYLGRSRESSRSNPKY